MALIKQSEDDFHWSDSASDDWEGWKTDINTKIKAICAENSLNNLEK